jgi:Cdc6-like AAA superfamily ATPase
MKDHRSLIVDNTSLAEFRSNRENREKRIIEERDEKNEQRFRELRTWLQGADFEHDHDTLRRAQLPGTGRWLFENTQFKRWFDPLSTYSLLWMNGLPGAGKSVLASMVVEEIKAVARNRHPQPSCIYFYCKEGDGERDNFVAIGRSLLLQLLTHEPQMVDYPYSAYRESRQTILRARLVVEDLLKKALLACPSVYIVLDGIDECATEERQGIVQWFKKVVEELPAASSNQLRVLFVSQSDTRERRDFSGIASLKIKAEDNKSDVATFARTEAAKIQDKFGITELHKAHISDRIPQSCGGR